MLVYAGTIGGWSIWAALIILSREILVSGLREFLAELNVKVHVTQLAKWKTAPQFIASGDAACRTGGGRHPAGNDERRHSSSMGCGTADAG